MIFFIKILLNVFVDIEKMLNVSNCRVSFWVNMKIASYCIVKDHTFFMGCCNKIRNSGLPLYVKEYKRL
jgi:hypothetical protein